MAPRAETRIATTTHVLFATVSSFDLHRVRSAAPQASKQVVFIALAILILKDGIQAGEVQLVQVVQHHALKSLSPIGLVTQMINQRLHPGSRFFQIASKPGHAMVVQQRAVQTIAAQEIFGTVTNCDDSPLFYCAARIRIYAGVPRVEVGTIFLVLVLILLFRVEVNDAFFYLITVSLRFQRLLGTFVAGRLGEIGQDRTARALALCD